MKDLTHYFVSPKKASENINTVRINNVDNFMDNDQDDENRLIEGKDSNPINAIAVGIGENNNISEPIIGEVENNKDSNKIIVINKEKRKRSRVKIRISLKDTKINSRCDIIESKNDFVDKTPSPFNKKVNNETVNMVKNNDCDDKLLVENKEESTTTITTPANAFQVLMTRRNKSLILSTQKIEDTSLSLTPVSRVNVNNNKNDDDTINNKVIKERSEIDDTVEVRCSDLKKKNNIKKGGYSKRKITEIEEVGEFGDNEIKKPAKLLRRDEGEKTFKDEDDDDKGEMKNDIQNGETKTKTKTKQKLDTEENRSKEPTVSLNNNQTDNNNIRKETTKINKKKNQHDRGGSSKSKKDFTELHNDDDRRPAIGISQSQNSSTTPLSQTELTPKSKTKWTMRVKLQSRSDNDDNNEEIEQKKQTGENETSSDEDYIFTPKSKVKYRKKRIRITIESESEREGDKKIEIENEREEMGSKIVVDTLENNSSSSSGSTITSKKHSKQKTKTKKNERKLKKEKNSETVLTKIVECDKMNGDDKTADVSVEILKVIENRDFENANKAGKPISGEKKLAPLFVKRSKPNPAIIEAKKSFLKSGIPENVKKILITEQKVSPNDSGFVSTMPFPVISHVPQSETEGNSEIPKSDEDKSPKNFFYKKRSKSAIDDSLDLDPGKLKSLLNFKGEEISVQNREKFSLIKKEDYENIVKEIEPRCSDARKIWESVLSSSSSPSDSNKEIEAKKSPPKKSRTNTKRLKLQRRSEVLSNKSPPEGEENSDDPNPTWICKYKPTSSAEFIGNESAIGKLKNWLIGWRVPAPSRKEIDSSGDEFYSSDCSSSSYYENNQVAVLIGPYGSGKTASVYALAEELGYRVLEANASSKRTGKKILSDFQEATKSHRVKRDQKTVTKGRLMTLKKKSADKKVPQQNSLILIEDVDLIFEEDEGFVSATFQLAANTRRPIVMTCRESCPHLNRMAPQQQFINFQNVQGNRVSVLLELIALAESGYRLPKASLDILLRNGDLRQSLLQLQYILLSGPPSPSQLGIIPGSTLWEDLNPLMYKPAIKSSKRCRREFENDEKKSFREDKRLCELLANKLDNVILISSLSEVENPASPPWRRKLNASLSLLEDFQTYESSLDLGMEISNYLRLKSLGNYEKAVFNSLEQNRNSRSDFSVKRKVKIGIDSALSQAISSHSDLNRVCKSTDYLPVIRNICRSEENRSNINTKRGNRFYNYLNGLNLASASNNILSAASSILRDKVKD